MWKYLNYATGGNIKRYNQLRNKVFHIDLLFSSVQLLSRVRLFATPESQHARPSCPSPTPGVHSDSRPSSQWCHPAISSSVVPFSSCPQSLPASESFPMSERCIAKRNKTYVYTKTCTWKLMPVLIIMAKMLKETYCSSEKC